VASPLPPARHRPPPELLDELRGVCSHWLDRPGEFDLHFDVNLSALVRLPDLTTAEGLTICRELAHAVVLSLAAGDDVDTVEARWRDLGTVHAAHDFPDEGYSAVGRALVRTARDLAGEGWGVELSSGLAALHLWMVGHLTAGASRGRAVAGSGWGWAPGPESLEQSPLEDQSAGSMFDALLAASRPAEPAMAVGGTPPAPLATDGVLPADAGRPGDVAPDGEAAESGADDEPVQSTRADDGMPLPEDIIGMVLGGPPRSRASRRKRRNT
jgi:hypothetical protein